MDNGFTLGSLFDGIGGFPYAASFFGIKALWASEIMPECISITKRHFPDMEHVGDITKIHGGELKPVDIITFGSPCQDLSQAAGGKRLGLAGERSGLFREAVRIIREMKGETDGKYPKFAVWENVPGALSSSGRRDFKAVLEAFTETEIPMPCSGRWADAGMVRSGGTDLAWCVYDARLFGTAQRRRRVFLVASFGKPCAGEILFIPKSLHGYFEEGGTTGERAAICPENSVRETGRKAYVIGSYKSNSMMSDNPHSGFYETDTSRTLDRNGGNPCCHQGGLAIVESRECYQKEVGALCASDSKAPNSQYVQQNKLIVEETAVRRLTPKECERLQGYPDGWTETGVDGKPISDTKRYQMLGNSVAVPCVAYIMQGICNAEQDGSVYENRAD